MGTGFVYCCKKCNVMGSSVKCVTLRGSVRTSMADVKSNYFRFGELEAVSFWFVSAYAKSMCSACIQWLVCR